MAGCMVATSLAMAPAMLVAQRARVVDLDGPLLLARDRPDGLRYEASLVHPPTPALWGSRRRAEGPSVVCRRSSDKLAPAAAGACPGKVGTGFPARTCAKPKNLGRDRTTGFREDADAQQARRPGCWA